jgi:hypothetical protein
VSLAHQRPFGVGRTLQTRLRRDRLLCPAAHGDDTRRDDSENTIDDWGGASGKGSEQSIFKRTFESFCLSVEPCFFRTFVDTVLPPGVMQEMLLLLYS